MAKRPPSVVGVALAYRLFDIQPGKGGKVPCVHLLLYCLMLGLVLAACPLPARDTADAPPMVVEGRPIPPPPRPDGTGSLPVSLGLYLIQLSNLDQVRQTFEIEGYLEARWSDPRLAFDAHAFGAPMKVYHEERARQKFGEDMWWPSIEFVNAVSGGTIDRHWLEIRADGEVNYNARFNATVSSSMDLRRFPFDTQSLQIHIESYFHPIEDMDFIINPDSTGFDESHPLPDWIVTRVFTSLGVKDYGQVGDFYGQYSRLTFHIEIRRQWGFYLWKVFLPLMMILACSWTVFWIHDLETNIMIAFTVLLTVVAFNLAIADTLPRVPYLTFMDAVMVVSYAGVFLSLMVIMAGHLLERAERNDDVRRLQAISRWAFPLGLVAVLLLLSAAYLH